MEMPTFYGTQGRFGSRADPGFMHKPSHRHPRLPTPDSSMRSDYRSESESPRSACGLARRDVYPMIADNKPSYFDHGHGQSNHLEHMRHATPSSPPYNVAEPQKQSLPSLRSILDGSHLSSPPQTPLAQDFSMQLSPREPALTEATYKPLALYPGSKPRLIPGESSSSGSLDIGSSSEITSSSQSPDRTATISGTNHPSYPSKLFPSVDIHSADRLQASRLPNGNRVYTQHIATPSLGQHRSYEVDCLMSDVGHVDFGPHTALAHRMPASLPVHHSFPGQPGHQYGQRSQAKPYSAGQRIHSDPCLPSLHAGFVGSPRKSPRSVNYYDNQPERARKRSNLPKHAVDMMKQWFDRNIGNPYPTEDQKDKMSKVAGITMTQVSNWFINHRRRCPELRDRRDRVYKRGMDMSRL